MLKQKIKTCSQFSFAPKLAELEPFSCKEVKNAKYWWNHSSISNSPDFKMATIFLLFEIENLIFFSFIVLQFSTLGKFVQKVWHADSNMTPCDKNIVPHFSVTLFTPFYLYKLYNVMPFDTRTFSFPKI